MPQLRRQLQHEKMWFWAGAETVFLLAGLIILVKICTTSQHDVVNKIVTIKQHPQVITHIASHAELSQAKAQK